MVTVANSLVILIDTNYGGTGQGGTKPSVINVLDNKRTPPFPPHTESIVVWLTKPRTVDQTNTDYATIKYELSVHIATPESDDRLKTITDEVRRVVNTYAISYINNQKVGDEEDVSDRRLPQYKQVLAVSLEQNMFPSTIAWSTSILDENAIHDNEAAEIQGIAEKVTPADGDILIIEDSAASYIKKRVQISNLPGGNGGGDADAIHDNVANEITAITPKTTLVTADEFILEDSAAAFVKKAVTFGNIESSIDKYTQAQVDTAIDTDISTHAGISGAHHTAYTDTDTEAVITAEIVNGQSIDNAIDALISTHAGIATAHQDAPGLISTHAAIATAHQDAPGLIATHAAISGAHHAQSHALAGGDHSAAGLTVGWVISADSATTFSWKAPTGGSDPNAIHDNVADEIHQIALKGTPVSADELVIEDSAASWNKKRVAISSLPAGSPSFGSPTGAIDIGDAETEGSSGDSSRADHQHAFTAPGAGYPLDVAAAESDGVATTPARSDHIHAHGTGYLPDAHHVAFVLADFTTAFAAESLANLTTRTHASLSDAPTDAHHNEAHVLATTGPHTGTLPVADITNGTQHQVLRAGASNPEWGDETFTKGAVILSPAVGYKTVWIAPFACTITTLRGRQKGGTSTVINARHNGTNQVATADLTLTSADTSYSTSTLTQTAVAAGEFLEIEVVTVGSATEILIQLDLDRP